MGLFDRFKKKKKERSPDKYDDLIPYVGISQRKFFMTTEDKEIGKMEKEIKNSPK